MSWARYAGREPAPEVPPRHRFDRAVTDFSHRYADQNERDYEEFVKAIHSGRLEAREGV